MTINVERAAVEIAAAVTGTSDVNGLTGAMVNLKAATADLDKQQTAYMKSLANTTATFGKSKTEILAMKAEMLGVSGAASPMINALKEMGADGEHSFAQMITSGGVFREVLVLLHESLIMGNWSRFGGSLMVISERMELAPLLFTALGAAALGAAAGVAAFGAALIMGEQESTKFAESMTITNGMAGITEGQFRAMAAAIGEDVPGGALKGRNALMDLIATGQFSGATLFAVAQAATEMARFTGQSAADVVKSFDDMKGNAADWAAKMNESYHFLTSAQYEYIEQLQQQGETEKAEQAAANDLYNSLAQNGSQNLGILESAWNGVRDAVRGAFSAMEDVGRASTIEQQIASLQSEKAQAGRYERGAVPGIDSKIAALQKQLADQQSAAAARSTDDQVQEAGISADQKLAGTYSPPVDELKKAISDYNQAIADAIAANPNDPLAKSLAKHTGATYDAEIERLKKQYGQQDKPDDTGTKINKPDANGYDIGSDDPDKLTTQLSLMQKYASATKSSEQAVLDLSIAQGKLNGFTQAQIAELRDRAAQDDDLNYTKDSTSESTALQNQVRVYQQQAAAMNETGESYKQLQAWEEKEKAALEDLEAKRAALIKQYPQEAASINAMFADQKSQIEAAYNSLDTRTPLQHMVEGVQGSAQQIQGIWGAAFNGMSDTMTSMLTGGTFSFRQMTDSIIDDMVKMVIETQILLPLMKDLGGASGAAGGSGAGLAGMGSSGSTDQSFITSLLKGASAYFADGGIMTSRGAVPLNKYANGGIADSPQVAMFGEGKGPEAYVPLPDGRSIPVSMKGGGGGGHTFVTNVNISGDGSTSGDSQKQATTMQRAVVSTIRQELVKQNQDGGMFSSTGNPRG